MENYQGENSIPYDLRQIYAVHIVGEHLKDVARARKENNYKAYFECLKDLWVVTQHKIKIKDKKAPEAYEKLLGKIVNTINKYSTAFLKTSNNAQGSWEIEKVLNELEMFLYDKMEEAKLFGSKRDVEQLV